MKRNRKVYKKALHAAAFMAAFAGYSHATERAQYISIGGDTRPPIGWVDFCNETPGECQGRTSDPRDVVLNKQSMRDLERVNKYVNRSITPVTDQEHWGVAERWSLPSDSKGDCEDYVLLKRRILIEAGWPRESLLITVVRDKKGDGHAVLTVKTDKGEVILDNQEERILSWQTTGYRFVKRQSQWDVNVWVSLGDSRGAPATAAAR